MKFPGKIRKTAACFLLFCIVLACIPVHAEENEAVEISAPSGVLMEPETKMILYEKDKDTRRSPASVTKVMTLLLIFDHLKDGSLKLTDTVTTSAHAKSMGGSQVFLEEGETQDVETMIKCIVVASGNDASVAMAEHIAGSEEAFVKEMNARAEGLGMENTHFVDCCGLTDSDEHYTTAYDIALMSRELILNYPEIFQYSSIWMENITHVTRQGSKEFGLTNTNRLIRTYSGCIGLKTGSTSKAGFCLSAVAERNELMLISVVMAAPDYKARLKDAASLLDYGFARCCRYIDNKPAELPELSVKKGKEETVSLSYDGTFRYLDTEGHSISDVKKEISLPEKTEAPIKKGAKAGEVIYTAGDKELGRLTILYAEDIERAGYLDCLRKTAGYLWLTAGQESFDKWSKQKLGEENNERNQNTRCSGTYPVPRHHTDHQRSEKGSFIQKRTYRKGRRHTCTSFCRKRASFRVGEKGGDPSRKRGSRDPLQDFRRRAYAWK